MNSIIQSYWSNRYEQNNFFYAINSDGTFTKITGGSIVSDGGTARGGSWFDYDNDGDQDLFVPIGNGEKN
ncbi:MAG: VCBS repeat-containing protein, partial [Candidatus Marinimicrobia bacterium]|nr:VCBS repeat-containing protein [Candidatus Neomarinimicrobiota bacterium]